MIRLVGIVSVSLAVASCSMPAALDPKGPEAEVLTWLIWFFTATCGVIWVLVVAALVFGLGRRHALRPDPLASTPTEERRFGMVIGSLTVLTGVTVIGLTLLSYVAQQRIYGATAPEVNFDVIGHQWWWEVRYNDPDPSKSFVTANEFHVPVGKKVRLTLNSTDVIHSFWMPNLMGKQDLVPGRPNDISFTADEPGIYAGQCAEYCGAQHTFMGMRIVVDEPADFEAWKAAQAAPAAEAAEEPQRAGRESFLANPCASCHAIRGTTAGATQGPDLTHLASRTTIGAGRVPLNRGTLAAWIADAQQLKPGVYMPTMKLEADELNSIVDYLMELK